MHTLKKIFKLFIPPFLILFYHKIRSFFSSQKNKPGWHTVNIGLLSGVELFINDHLESYRDMLNGNYDLFFYEYLKNIDLDKKTVLDIGSHIGYHSLGFSKLVGKEGKVFSFDANIYNVNRENKIIEKNKIKNIEVINKAVSNKSGEVEFNFSDNIDNLTSSGGYIEGAQKPLLDVNYKNAGFKKHKVPVITLDNFFTENKGSDIKLMKIDVEGAEEFVLEGGINLLKKYKPILLIEVHSVIAMKNVCQILYGLNYKIEIIEEGGLSRCFIAAN